MITNAVGRSVKVNPLSRSFGAIAHRDESVTDEQQEKRIAAYAAASGVTCLTCYGYGKVPSVFEYQEPWMAKPMQAKRAVVCPDCRGVKESPEVALQRRKRTAGLDHTMIEAFTFERFRLDMNPAMASALREAQSWAAHPHGGMVLSGTTGLGKTHLAVAALQVCITNGLTCAYAEARLLLSELQQGIRNDNYHQVLDWWRDGASVILIDDFGAQRNTEFSQDVIEDIVTYRYARDRAFILTTNMGPRDTPERLRSRFGDNSRVAFMLCEGDDVRPKL